MKNETSYPEQARYYSTTKHFVEETSAFPIPLDRKHLISSRAVSCLFVQARLSLNNLRPN